MIDGMDQVIERPVDRRSFLRGSAIFAAALGLSVASTAFAQDPPQKPEEKKKKKKPEENDPPAEDEKLNGDKNSETKIDTDGREYRTCPQCASNMYKQGRTWTCENCGYSYVEESRVAALSFDELRAPRACRGVKRCATARPHPRGLRAAPGCTGPQAGPRPPDSVARRSSAKGASADAPFSFWAASEHTIPPMTLTLDMQTRSALTALDAWVRELMQWHFDPATGCPFWLEWAQKAGWDPRREIQSYADLRRFGFFQDEWLRGGPVRRWVPRAFADRPISVFETGGTTGVPKTRVNIDDFRTDYEWFSATLPDQYFPKGGDWLQVGPSGPRRLRLAVEHLANYRGGICFMVDLDPRWVIKLIAKGWSEHLQAYKDHVIDQAVTILGAGHSIRCLFTTPKLLEALALRLDAMGTTIRKAGITGIFSGGTEFTPQWNRFANEELLDGAYMTPTYGNTLMGLAPSEPSGRYNNYKITYHAPQPRAVIEVVDFDDPSRVVEYGQPGRVRLTTLTKEFFMPGFLERDEGERELPCVVFPWDGVSGVRPYRGFAATTTVGVY